MFPLLYVVSYSRYRIKWILSIHNVVLCPLQPPRCKRDPVPLGQQALVSLSVSLYWSQHVSSLSGNITLLFLLFITPYKHHNTIYTAFSCD